MVHANENTPATFIVGRTYYDRSSCDWDCVFQFTILERTAKAVTIDVHGKRCRRGIRVCDGVETFRPFGTYSMCAIVSARRPIESLNR